MHNVNKIVRHFTSIITDASHKSIRKTLLHLLQYYKTLVP